MIIKRAVSLALGAALMFATAACQEQGQTTTGATRPTASDTPSLAAPTSLELQDPFEVSSGRTGPTERRLSIEADGSWICENCAGNNKNSSGKLGAAQMQQLLGPGLIDEDRAQQGKKTPRCSGELLSTLVSGYGVVMWSDCPGNQPPPITAAILRVLTAETPLVAGTPAV
ncbi:hypothetical protein [Micromonospora echinaurantiaca]|uniref:hypothetical protein n=1 Tax=Micromonospora echinaurantiaca TaxID=47857 RepID=UPI003439A989